MQDLKLRYMLFVDAYIKNGGNASKAVIEAGYSENGAKVQGNALLTNPNISKAIQERKESISQQMGITEEFAIKELIDIRAKAEEAKQFSAALKASELIYRMAGLLKDYRTQRNVQINHYHDQVKAISNERLIEIAEKELK